MVAFKELDTIEPGTSLESLKRSQVVDVQRALAFICYPVGVIDGGVGPRTRNAWAEFKEDIGEGNPTILSEASIETLKDKLHKIEGLIRGPASNTNQVKDAIAALCRAMGLGLKPQVAYVLATTEWETSHTFKPVKEAFWLSESWRKAHLRYYPFYGRGYVQLTWKRNYENYSNILQVEMVQNPNLALDGHTALFVLVHGFKTGTFTGRFLEEYINTHQTDYRNARRCINGLDKADDIKRLAEQYFEQL